MDRKRYTPVIVLLVLAFLVSGCAKGNDGIKELSDIEVSSQTDGQSSNVGELIWDNLQVQVTFPDGWSVSSTNESEKKTETHVIFGNSPGGIENCEIREFSTKYVDINENNMTRKSDAAVKKYVQSMIANDTAYYKDKKYQGWKDTNYQIETVSGQRYLVASGVEEKRKDFGDARLGYFTVKNGHFIEILLKSERREFSDEDKSAITEMVKSITYTDA